MNRQAILSALVRLDAPIVELRSAMEALTWDADQVIVLTRRDVAAILQRYEITEIDAATVEEWANLIECREDIQFEPGKEEIVASAIHDLANPELQGRLQDIAPRVLSSLR